MSLADEIARYFAAERSGAWVFIAVGVLAIVVPLLFILRDGGSLAKGFAVPVVIIGIIQVIVGATVALRTPSHLAGIDARLASDAAGLKRDEAARMTKVMSGFKTFKIVEVVFIAAGLAGCLFVSQPFWLGIAMGMLIQGALMLPADIVAERRGAVYQEALLSAR